MENEEILICKKCGIKIKDFEQVASLEVGTLEPDILDGMVVPLVQGAETRALWHEKCYKEEEIKS